MTRYAGHLFVVHGTIETLIHDAAVVPVGAEYRFEEHWRTLVGDHPVLPDDWSRRQWGRIHNAPDRVWAVSVGGSRADPYDVVVERIVNVLRRVDERRHLHEAQRGTSTIPLVAVPVVGIGRGGHDHNRGEVLRALVERLGAEARELCVDVALVTPEPAVYAAAQYARRKLVPRLPDALEVSAEELGAAARAGSLALVLGAGVSAAAGLPSWTQLIERLARDLRVTEVDFNDKNFTPTDQAELIEQYAKKDFPERVAKVVSAKSRSSLLHGLLAGLDCGEVITTNYDLLYEQAVRASGRTVDSILPWASGRDADRWILKLHGDVAHPKTIVLTRRHMVRYDAAFRPSGALLQSLLLTRKVLVVGTSMTDDNVIRLLHEVEAYRQEHHEGRSGTFGTVLDTDGDKVRAQLWKGQLEWLFMGDAAPEVSGYRGVELFLDRVALHASRDSSWVLDERFAGLLTPHEQLFAQQLRDVTSGITSRLGTKWDPLVERLIEMGVRPPDGRP